ncbi:MAG: hypothetical protein KF819_35220 [Labilithrix sp.]|nr:hypothetical protein [Labilithrix sp.]
MNDLAHDAGIVAKDETLKARAGLKSSAEAWSTRHHGGPGDAAKHVPERPAAIMKWLDDNGFAEKRRGDVAFGKGGEYYNWLTGYGARAGVELAVESRKVHERTPAPGAFQCRG